MACTPYWGNRGGGLHRKQFLTNSKSAYLSITSKMSSYIQDKISVSGFLVANLHQTFSLYSHGTGIPKAKILFAAVHWFENPSKLHNCNHQRVSGWRFSLQLHLRIILQCQQFTCDWHCLLLTWQVLICQAENNYKEHFVVISRYISRTSKP